MNQKNLKGFILFLVVALCLSGMPAYASALDEKDTLLEEIAPVSSTTEGGYEEPSAIATPTELLLSDPSSDPEDLSLQTDGKESETPDEAPEEVLPGEEPGEQKITEPVSAPVEEDPDDGSKEDPPKDILPDVTPVPGEPEKPALEGEGTISEEQLPERPGTAETIDEAELPELSDELSIRMEDYRYTLLFDANGGNGQMSALTDRTNGKTFTLPYNTFRRTGYSFEEWNTMPDGSGESISNRAKLTSPAEEDGATITLYAQWLPVSYRITYKNLLPADSNPNPISYTFGQSVALLPLSRPGFSFDGWFEDVFLHSPVSVLNEDGLSAKGLTVYAKWTAARYSIAFDGNSLGRGNVRGNMKTLKDRLCGKTYTLPSNGFKMDGYTFLGWSTDPYAFIPLYHNRAHVSNLSLNEGETVTLYAVWQANSLRNEN